MVEPEIGENLLFDFMTRERKDSSISCGPLVKLTFGFDSAEKWVFGKNKLNI